VIADEEDASLVFQVINTDNKISRIKFFIPLYGNLFTAAQLMCSDFSLDDSTCKEVIALYKKQKIGRVDSSHPHFVPRSVREARLHNHEIKSLSSFVTMLNPKKCYDQGASESLQRNIARRFTFSEMNIWQGGETGNWRNAHHVYVPCGEGYHWWVQEGPWHAVPMYTSQFNKGVAVAKCQVELASFPFSCDLKLGMDGKCYDDYIPFCGSNIHAAPVSHQQFGYQEERHATITHASNNGCLAYTFGVDGFFNFEGYLTQTHGCEVHTFDPSDESREVNMKGETNIENIYYHYIGIDGKTELRDDEDFEDDITPVNDYGRMGGSFMTLSDIMTVLGHSNSSSSSDVYDSMTENGIQNLLKSLSHKYLTHPIPDHNPKKLKILKIDCEGCEWKVLHQIAAETPELLDNVCTIVLEIHLATTLMVAKTDSLRYIAYFFENYIERMGFRVQTLHPNPGTFHHRHNVNPVLVELGLDAGVCCYDVVLVRNDC
jgi:hypothetical protein